MYNDVKEYFLSKKHRALRKTITANLVSEYEKLGLSCAERVTQRFEFL